MSYEITKSEKSGKFRYLFRHPATGKTAAMSQGSWNDVDKAMDEAELVVKNIVEQTDHGAKLASRVNEMDQALQASKSRIGALENKLKNERDLAHAIGERLHRVKGARAIIALVAILGLLANAYQYLTAL